MTQQEKIKEILSQKNYRVSAGKVLRYDRMDDRFKPVIVSGNRIPLVKDGSIVEIFEFDDVAVVIDGWQGQVDATEDKVIAKAKTEKASKQPVQKKAAKQKPTKKAKDKPKSTKKSYPKGKDRACLSKEDISFIQAEARKKDGMSVNKMAEKFRVSRFTVGHHWRKIKNAK